MARAKPPVGSLRTPEEIRRAILANGGGDGFWVEAELPAGPQGPQGPPGKDGQDGATGPAGEKGDQGPQGDKGDKGDKGEPGDTPDIEWDGEHVVVGNPLDPAVQADWDDNQLMWDGVSWELGDGTGVQGPQGPVGPVGPEGPVGPAGPEGPGGADGKDGLPGTNGQDGAPGVDGQDGAPGADGQDVDASAYLPLTGGTLTGDVTVEGDLQVGPRDYFQVYTSGSVRSSGIANKVGSESLIPNVFVNTVNNTLYRSLWTPSSMAFAPSKLGRNSDVLGRAETATMPPEIETDDEGNQTNTAEVEAHDAVRLFDVVTALLAKVKELSARIEELEGS